MRACEERAIFFKSSLEAFETDDENQDADEFIEEDDFTELARVLTKNGLDEAANKLKQDSDSIK